MFRNDKENGNRRIITEKWKPFDVNPYKWKPFGNNSFF
jgi:hypothetical protein